MRKLLLSAVLTLASFAPASAQQTATVDSNIRLAPVSIVSVYGDAARRARVRKSAATYPRVIARDRRVNCYNPYIGNWKHGYPRDDESC
jgi:hypothetical protein